MTYEEAIEEMENIYQNGFDNDFDNDEIEKPLDAIRMAIEALEKQILNEADGCTGCAFESYEEWEMPCKKCKRNSKDYWRAKA